MSDDLFTMQMNRIAAALIAGCDKNGVTMVNHRDLDALYSSWLKHRGALAREWAATPVQPVVDKPFISVRPNVYDANVFLPGCLGPVSREVCLADSVLRLLEQYEAEMKRLCKELDDCKDDGK